VKRTLARLHQFKRLRSATTYAPTSTLACSNTPAASSARNGFEPHSETISKRVTRRRVMPCPRFLSVSVVPSPAGFQVYGPA
jgi:hypothetical protein